MLSRSDLHPYQERVIELAKTMPHLGLFLEPGLGKTVTTLTILSDSPSSKRTLIVAPKKIAENVWAQECQKWEHLQHIKVAKVIGTPKQRLSALNSASQIFIVNLENLKWLLDLNPKFDILVIDESSRFKDPSTQRFKALKKNLKTFQRRIILTGTPAPQKLTDLWSQVGILDLGQRLETSITKFRDKYLLPDQRNRHTGMVYTWKLQPGADKAIKSAISDICFSLRAEDYLTLPKQTIVHHKIAMDADTASQYKQLKRDMVTQIGDIEITAATAATLMGKLLQFTSGALYDENKEWHEVHDAKLEFLESLLEEAAHPTLVFYHFKSSLERLQARFPHAQLLTDANIPLWQAGKIPLMLAQPMSGGIGLNLQCNEGDMAQTVWYDLPWSTENYIQANARIYRQGQIKPVMLHHLVLAGTADERVLEVIKGNVNTQDALLKELKLE